MDLLINFIVAAVAAVLGAVGIKLLDRLRRKDAESEAKQIVDKAKQDADTARRESELAIKEATLQQRTETERELSKSRDELRDRERILDKRQETVEQQADQVRKQERMVEGTQRRLAEKIEDAEHQKTELQKVMDMHRQTLHELSGLSRDEATQRLLKTLEDEMQQETGAIILNYQKKMEEECKTRAAKC